MSVTVQKRESEYRVVESDGTLAKNAAGTAADGGGHATKEAATKQARAINRHAAHDSRQYCDSHL